jgi:purine-binding chemotaxis protein CheW
MAEQVIEEEELVAEEVETDQYLVFAAKSQEFGFQAMRVQEISRVMPITPVPNAPRSIEGIMNLRGRIASVINFRKKFGFEPKAFDEDTRVIVVELGTHPIGIIVDSVAEVLKIPDQSVQKLPESTIPTESREYITGIGMLDKRLIILLDLDKVLTGAELAEIGKYSEAMSKDQIAENLKPTTSDFGKAQKQESVADETQNVKKTKDTKGSVPDTAIPPVETGKRQRKRRTE